MLYIIVTCCIHNTVGVMNTTSREERYIECITALLDLVQGDDRVKVILVENNGERKTFLDSFGCDVVYTTTNKQNLKKGVKELLDIQSVIDRYAMHDDDMIIKLTGRYKLLNRTFIDTVLSSMNTKSALLKFYNVCTQTFEPHDCVLGLYAIRCKYLKRFKYTGQGSYESEFAIYVKHAILAKERIQEVDTLSLECCFADDLRILVV
jgi:hypothetical protein